MRRSLSLLCRRGICLLLAASYIVCLCAASLNAAPGSRSGSIASLELLPRAENPHLPRMIRACRVDPRNVGQEPAKLGKPVPAPSRDPVAPPVPVRLRLRDHGCRAIPTYAACSLPAAPPLADPPFSWIPSCRRISPARPAFRSTP
ncbi:MAG: hypothetical protein ACLRWP_11275 [Bilophila wadsworthia]